MERAHYLLQALLYTVALHRFLRWRLPGYDPERHLAGVLYLFVRGMVGAATPVVDGAPCGVFAWRPPARLVDGAQRRPRRRRRAVSALAPIRSTAAARVVAPGLLRAFNDAGVLAAADVHVALRLAALVGRRRRARRARRRARGPRAAARARLRRPRDDPRHRDGRIRGRRRPVRARGPLRTSGSRALSGTPLVAVGEEDDRSAVPLRLVGTALYLDRYWREERAVAADLLAFAGAPPQAIRDDVLSDGLGRLFDADAAGDARADAANDWPPPPRCCGASRSSPAAPARARPRPSRGSSRCWPSRPRPRDRRRRSSRSPRRPARPRRGCEEAVHEEAAKLDVDDAVREQLLGARRASTLHRLLGWRPGSHSRFRHDRANRLPHDVVIVDETSMVSLSLMARLVEAVRPDARLVLVGDPGQLTSIEAGAVLGDIVGPAADGLRMRPAAHVWPERPARSPASPSPAHRGRRRHRRPRPRPSLRRGDRELADAIRRGDADAVVAALRRGPTTSRGSTVDAADRRGSRRSRRSATARRRRPAVIAAARAGRRPRGASTALGAVPRALRAPARRRTACATWTARIEGWLADAVAGFAAERRLVRRAPAARDRERLRAAALQRRHGRRRRDAPAAA